ncbi:MAG: DMT family transporter [Xanthobacteraceae bacterium]|nr:DMT family transporter [Xanthobacteraceae bacterium]
MRSAPLRAYVILTLMPLFFVSNVILGRVAVQSVEPWTLAFLRWSLSALIVLPLASSDVRRHARAFLAEWRLMLLLGFLGMGICGGGVYLSLRYTTATNATLIYAGFPAIVVLLDAFLRREMLAPARGLGVVTALAGVVVIVLEGDPGRLASLAFNPGDIGFVVAAVAWAVYSLLLKRRALQALPTIATFFAIAVAGTLTLAPFMLWEVVGHGVVPRDLPAWLSIAAIVVFSSVLPFSAFQYGVKVVGPAVTSVFMYLLPPYGVALAWMFLGETFRPYHALGLALVVAGIVLATWSGAPRATAR